VCHLGESFAFRYFQYMGKPSRKSAASGVELLIFHRSRRRCALCYWLKGDLTEKNGQIAHLDDDRSNSSEDNLAFLCLDHHSVYDSTTSQHKGYTIHEAKKAREDLCAAIEEGKHLQYGLIMAANQAEDRQIFSSMRELLANDIDFFRKHDLGNSFPWKRIDCLDHLSSRGRGAEHEFLDKELEILRVRLIDHGTSLVRMIAENTSSLETKPDWVKVSPIEEAFKDWTERKEFIDELNRSASRFCEAYDNLLRVGRRKL
jgi:hypothetical protein